MRDGPFGTRTLNRPCASVTTPFVPLTATRAFPIAAALEASSPSRGSAEACCTRPRVRRPRSASDASRDGSRASRRGDGGCRTRACGLRRRTDPRSDRFPATSVSTASTECGPAAVDPCPGAARLRPVGGHGSLTRRNGAGAGFIAESLDRPVRDRQSERRRLHSAAVVDESHPEVDDADERVAAHDLAGDWTGDDARATASRDGDASAVAKMQPGHVVEAGTRPIAGSRSGSRRSWPEDRVARTLRRHGQSRDRLPVFRVGDLFEDPRTGVGAHGVLDRRGVTRSRETPERQGADRRAAWGRERPAQAQRASRRGARGELGDRRRAVDNGPANPVASLAPGAVGRPRGHRRRLPARVDTTPRHRFRPARPRPVPRPPTGVALVSATMIDPHTLS